MDLQKEASILKNEKNTQYSENFITKITNLKNEFNSEIDSINSTTISLLNEISKIKKSVDQIKNENMRELNFIISHFEQFSIGNLADFKNQIKNLSQKFLTEVETIEKESQIKINNFLNESEKTQKNLLYQHLSEIEKLKLENTITTEIDSSLILQAKSKKDEFLKLRESFQNYFNSSNNNLNECRSKFKEITNFYSVDLIAFEKARGNLELRFNQTESDMLNEESSIENELKQKRSQFENELNEKQTALTNLIEELNNDFIEKLNSHKNDVSSSNFSVSELMFKLSKEKDEVISKYEKEKKLKIENSIQNLISLQQIEENEFAAKRKNLEDSLQGLKEDNFAEKASLLSLHQEKTEFEINRFSEEVMKLRQSIQLNSSNVNSILTANQETLSNLQNEKIDIISHKEEQNAKFSEKEKNEIEMLNKLYSLETEQLENAQKEIFDSYLRENGQLINQNDIDFQKKKEAVLAQHERERVEYLNKIRADFFHFSENKLNELNENYSILFDEKSHLLSQIQPPASTNDFSKMSNVANDLSIKRSELQRLISIERSKLIQMYENEINIEKTRKDNFLNDLKNSGRKNNGRDLLRQTLRMKISGIQGEKEEENTKFLNLLNEINQKHKIEMDQLSIEIASEREATKKAETDLNKKLLAEKENCEKEIEFTRSNYLNDKNTFNNEIELFQRENDQKKIEITERRNQLINDFENELDFLNNKMNQIHLVKDDEIDKERKSYLFKYSSMKKNHEIQKCDMKNSNSEMSASIARLLIQNRNELESLEKENKQTLSDCANKNDKEKCQLLQEKSSLIEFLNEKFETQKSLMIDAENRYINRPSRDIEIQKIKKYKKHCSLLTKVLKNGLNDIANYRKINSIKDKEYNKMFERNPSVGVLIVGSSKVDYKYY